MQPRLRRGSGSNDQVMKVSIKTLVLKIGEIFLAFFKPWRQKAGISSLYF